MGPAKKNQQNIDIVCSEHIELYTPKYMVLQKKNDIIWDDPDI